MLIVFIVCGTSSVTPWNPGSRLSDVWSASTTQECCSDQYATLLTHLRDTIAARSSTAQKSVDYEIEVEDNIFPSTHDESMHREAAIKPSGDKSESVAHARTHTHTHTHTHQYATLLLHAYTVGRPYVVLSTRTRCEFDNVKA